MILHKEQVQFFKILVHSLYHRFSNRFNQGLSVPIISYLLTYFDVYAAAWLYLHTEAAQLSQAAAGAARTPPARYKHHQQEMNSDLLLPSTPGCLSSPANNNNWEFLISFDTEYYKKNN